MINYYVDQYGNRYIDANGNYFILSTELSYLQHKSYIYNNGYKKCTAYICKNGEYVKVKPYINIQTAITMN